MRIDEFVEHRAQRRVVTTVSRLRRGDVHRGVHPRPMDRVPGVASELREEGALGAAVALPEWVQGVHIGQQHGEAVDESRSLESPEMTSPGELAEHVLGEGTKVLREAEQVTLADRDRAQLAGPVVQVAKDVAVEALQMGQIVPAQQAGSPKFDQPVARQFRLGLGKLGGIGDTEPVAQDPGFEIDVGVPAHLPYRARVRSRASSVLIRPSAMASSISSPSGLGSRPSARTDARASATASRCSAAANSDR